MIIMTKFLRSCCGQATVGGNSSKARRLKEIAPRVTRVAVLREPHHRCSIGQSAAIQTVGPVGLQLSAVDLRDAGEI